MRSIPKNRCFVIGPIGDVGSVVRKQSDFLLNVYIKPAVEHLGFHVLRADMIDEAGNIDFQVINNVLHSDLVVADLSDQNPNAFYELAIRHYARKPVIHVCERATKLPFDVAPYRTIFFENGAVEANVTKSIEAQARDILSNDFYVDNPISRVFSAYSQSSESPANLIRKSLDDICIRLSDVEKLLGSQKEHPSVSIGFVSFLSEGRLPSKAKGSVYYVVTNGAARESDPWFSIRQEATNFDILIVEMNSQHIDHFEYEYDLVFMYFDEKKAKEFARKFRFTLEKI